MNESDLLMELNDRTKFETAAYGSYLQEERAKAVKNPEQFKGIIEHVDFFRMRGNGQYQINELNFMWAGYQMGLLHAALADKEAVEMAKGDANG